MGLTTYIAIYAAVLSTAMFFWNVKNSKPDIKVELVVGIEKLDDDYVNGVYFFLKNSTPHDAHVSNVSLKYPFRKITFWNDLKWIFTYRRLHPYRHWTSSSMPFEEINTGLPLTILPFQSHSIFIPESVIKEMMKGSVGPFFAAQAQDPLWRNRYSKPFKL